LFLAKDKRKYVLVPSNIYGQFRFIKKSWNLAKELVTPEEIIKNLFSTKNIKGNTAWNLAVHASGLDF